MWQIKYQNEFFDLDADQSPEIERKSPLFLVDDALLEVSTPITIKYSDKNSRLIGAFFFDLTIKAKIKIDVELYDAGTYKANATLVIESAGMNREYTESTNASGYLMIGVSNFFSTLQLKKLTELALGGPRSFPFTTWDASDSSNGFMQHFQDTWQFDDDYVMVPCRNEFWSGIDDDIYSSGYMNELDANNNLKSEQDVVPFTKVSYLITQLFKEHGWNVDFTGLNDSNWLNLILFSARPIITRRAQYDIFDPSIITYTALSAVFYKLADFMPADYTCSDFLLQVCRRYGWAPLFNTSKRACRFVALKEIKNKTVKDWTRFAISASGTTLNPDLKIFGFTNSFEGGDRFPSEPSFEGFIIGTPVYSKDDLPNPYGISAYDTTQDNALIYVYLENQYYKVIYDTDIGGRVWVVHADNIYNDTTDKATVVFDTKVTTLPIYKTLYRNASSVDYYALFPLCEQSKFDKWGIRTLLYHGLVREVKADGTSGTLDYPYASSTNTKPNGTSPLPWSNVYKRTFDGADDGIVKYWWQDWLDIISGPEDQVKQVFNLPLQELNDFDWDQKILVNHIEYLIKSFVEKPVNDEGLVMIEATMQRLKSNFSLTDATATTIYLKVVIEDEVTGQHVEIVTSYQGTYVYDNLTTANVSIKAYSDAAGTIPLSVENLPIKITEKNFKDGVLNSGGWVFNMIMNGISVPFLNLTGPLYEEYDLSNSTYTVLNGHWLNQYFLVEDPGYVII